jgi:tellurite resistance protein
MGTAGLVIAWTQALSVLGVSNDIMRWAVLAVAIQFVAILVIFIAKGVFRPESVREELRHPVKLNFFATISISLILLSIAMIPFQPRAAEILWGAGAALHLLFTLYVLNVWMHRSDFEPHHINPAWFIPVVGNVLVPVAGAHFGYNEISWFFFSIGIVFWGVLFAIIVYRILFHQPLPDRLMPTLFILIAPPAVGFIAYVGLTGGIDPAARVLFGAAVFMTLLLLVQAPRFARLQFYLSWWAYSFPLAAVTTASFVMARVSENPGYALLGEALLVLTTAVIALILLQTILAILARDICRPEE